MLSRPPYKSESGLPSGISHGNQAAGEFFAPAAPTHSRPFSGAPPPNPRSSNAGEAEDYAARADTLSPSGV